jgi:hypothetical protein
MILAAVRCSGDGFGGFSWLRRGCWWGWRWQSWLLVLWCGGGGVVEVMRWRWFGDEMVTVSVVSRGSGEVVGGYGDDRAGCWCCGVVVEVVVVWWRWFGDEIVMW